MGSFVVGLDISLQCAAACAVPVDWALDWAKVSWMTVGGGLTKDASPRDRVRRVQEIASEVALFVKTLSLLTAVPPDVMIEQYAFGQSHMAHSLGEVGGAVKVAIFERTGLVTVPVVASSARKVLLGKCPKSTKEAKAKVLAFLESAGATCPNADAGDAYAVANYKLCEWGKGITMVGGR